MEFDRPITISLILVVILILMFFLVVPKYKSLQKLQLELAQKEAEYRAQFEYFSEIDKSFQEILGKKDEIQKIDDALPSSPELGQLVYYFQGKAKDTGLALKNFTISQAQGAGIKSIVFSLNLSGTYASLGNFIISLENSARLFEVSRISFGGGAVQSSSDTGSSVLGEPTFNFSLEVKTQSY